jgi:hypothetical protein
MPEPSAAFIAVRGMTLSVHDLTRRDLRAWLDVAVDFRGTMLDASVPDDPTMRVFAAAIASLTVDDRRDYRVWALKWTDYTGRIITPNEAANRRARIRASGPSFQ